LRGSKEEDDMKVDDVGVGIAATVAAGRGRRAGRGRGWVGCGLFAALLAAGPFAFAQAMSPAVIELFDAGRALADKGDHAGACAKFTEAIRIDGARRYGLLMNLGQCSEKQGKTATAWALYKEAAFTARRQSRAEDEANAVKLAAALEPRLAKLQINAGPGKATAGLVIRTDGQEVGAGALGTPIAVDPGSHAIEATAPGYTVWSTTVTVADGAVQVVEIPALVKAAAPPPAAVAAGGGGGSRRTAEFVSLGVGGVGLVLGVVAGAVAAGDHGSLASGCPEGNCPPSQWSKVDSYNATATLSTIGLAAGGALVGLGAVLLVTAPKGGAAAKVGFVVQPAAGGGGVAAVGSF
jgi:hypothetical protein